MNKYQIEIDIDYLRQEINTIQLSITRLQDSINNLIMLRCADNRRSIEDINAGDLL